MKLFRKSTLIYHFGLPFQHSIAKPHFVKLFKLDNQYLSTYNRFFHAKVHIYVFYKFNITDREYEDRDWG